MANSIDRKLFLGGSDIAAVMGLNRWCTPLMLWALKTGEIEPKDLSDNEAVELGSELEDFVAKKFERKTGKSVRRSPKYYTHPKYDIFKCQVDRLVEGTDELLECKTASAWKEKEWAGEEIPQEYILQVLWQLMITGRSVGHIACLIGGQKFVYKEIHADEEMFKKMTEAALTFWEMVKNKIPPIAMGPDNDFMIELYPRHTEQLQQIDELNDQIGLLQQLKRTIEETAKQKEEIEAQLKAIIGETLGIKTNEYFVTWKRQNSTSVDTQLMKTEGVYELYVKQKEIRVLRVRSNKKEQ